MEEQIRQQLADSGERLARAAAEMRQGKCTPENFFNEAAVHMQLLQGVGLADDAFATGVMALLTAFGARFNPVEHKAVYLSMLLQTAMAGAMAANIAAQKGDSFATGHYEAIDGELGPLVLASYRELDGAEVVPEMYRAPFESLADFVDASATFQDKPIAATLAPDILYDIASRLTAMGVIE